MLKKRSFSSAENNNSDLPEEVVSVILSKLVFKSSCSLSDYVRFPAVSTVWRRAFDASKLFDPPIKLPSQLPVLILQLNQDDDLSTTRYFYSFSDGGKVREFPLRGQSHNVMGYGSSHGWILTIATYQNHSVRLFNPFKSVDNEIQLPSLHSLFLDTHLRDDDCWYSIRKVCFSRNPSSASTFGDDELIVMVIIGSKDLGFCRLSDNRWVRVHFDSPYRPPGSSSYRKPFVGFEDVIYYKGMFHAVIPSGLVARIDLSPEYYPHPNLTVLDAVLPPPLEGGSHEDCGIFKHKYLVESSGDLLQVHRGFHPIDPYFDEKRRAYDSFSPNGHATDEFNVFKLVGKEWLRIKSLDGWSLFLGESASFSLPAYNYPGCIKPNRIYFTDDYDFRAIGEGPPDCGVYNVEDGSFEQLTSVDLRSICRDFPHWLQVMI